MISPEPPQFRLHGSAASAAVNNGGALVPSCSGVPSTEGVKKMRGSAPSPAGGNDFPRAPSIPPPGFAASAEERSCLERAHRKIWRFSAGKTTLQKIFFARFCTFFAAFRHKHRRGKRQRLFFAVWPFSKTVSETPSFDGRAQGAIMAVSRACRACAFLSSVADVAVRNCPRQDSLSA